MNHEFQLGDFKVTYQVRQPEQDSALRGSPSSPWPEIIHIMEWDEAEPEQPNLLRAMESVPRFLDHFVDKAYEDMKTFGITK